MRAAVIYYPADDKTRMVAGCLSGHDVDLIEVKSRFRLLSFLGFVCAPRFDAGKYDLIIVGCPAWKGRPSKPFMGAICKLDFKDKQVNAFVTYSVDPRNSLGELMAEVAGRNGHKGRMMSFNTAGAVDEHEVRKLLSF